MKIFLNTVQRIEQYGEVGPASQTFVKSSYITLEGIIPFFTNFDIFQNTVLAFASVTKYLDTVSSKIHYYMIFSDITFHCLS